MTWSSLSMVPSKHGAIAAHSNGWTAVAASAFRELSAGCPRAAFQHGAERKRVRIVRPEAKLRPHERCDLVEESDRECAPLHDRRRRYVVLLTQHARVFGREHAGIDEQAAVAVLGQTGQRASLGHFELGHAQR